MKTNTPNKEQTALEAYEEEQAEIQKLLKQIAAELEKSDRDRSEMVNWGHVGSLVYAAEKLTEVRDWLKGSGE